MKTVTRRNTAGKTADPLGKINTGNRNKLAALMTLTDPAFVNKWLNDLIEHLMDPECSNLADGLHGFYATKPEEALAIAKRVNRVQSKTLRLKAAGCRLIAYGKNYDQK
jgi:hypothetical protein